MANSEQQAYLQALEAEYEKPPLVRNLMPHPAAALNVSVTLAAGQKSPVVAGPVNFTVTFSRPVTGFVNADISFVGSTVGGTLAAAVTGTGPAYNVAVTGMTGNGLVACSVIPGAAADAVTGVLTPGSIAAFVRVSADVTPPSVVLSKAAGQADPASVGPINFTAVFSEPVMGLLPAGLDYVAGTTAPGTYTATVTGSGTTYNIAMSGMSGAGNVSLKINAAATTDFMTNPNTASAAVVVVYTPPTTGFPDATNTGVPGGTVLTPFVPVGVIVTNGLVIENKIIADTIEIAANNVTIRNCRIENSGIHGVFGSGLNITVDHCTLIGSGGSSVNTGILASGTFTANNISGYSIGIGLTGPGTVKDNYIHDLLRGGADPHYDCITMFGGQHNVLIEHNSLFVPSDHGTANVIVSNDPFGSVSDIVIRNNLCRGAPGYTIVVGGHVANGTVSNVSVVDNVLERGVFDYFSVDGDLAAFVNISGTGNRDYLTGAGVPFPDTNVGSPPAFPEASNTGPALGTVFTVTTGNLVTTSNGQVIAARQINNGIIDIRHSNVTVRDCIVNSTDFVALRTTGAGPFTGCLIERTRFVGTGGGPRLNAIQPDAMTGVEIRFCDISGFENGIAIGANGMNIHDNYIHDLSSGAPDPHFDGIQGGGGFTSLTIDHNTIISRDTSCIILQNEAAAFSGVTISNNKLIMTDGAYCILCQDRDDGVGAVSGVTVTNNRMNKGPNPAASYGFFHNVTGLIWTGNVNDATSVTINPDIG